MRWRLIEYGWCVVTALCHVRQGQRKRWRKRQREREKRLAVCRWLSGWHDGCLTGVRYDVTSAAASAASVPASVSDTINRRDSNERPTLSSSTAHYVTWCTVRQPMFDLSPYQKSPAESVSAELGAFARGFCPWGSCVRLLTSAASYVERFNVNSARSSKRFSLTL